MFETTLRPSVASLRPLRHAVANTLDGAVPEPTRDEVLLLLSELCTNAIEASSGRDGQIVVRVKVPADGTVLVEVEDSGDGFTLGRPLAAPDEESGRGLAIAMALADDIEVDRRDRRTCVRARLTPTRSVPAGL